MMGMNLNRSELDHHVNLYQWFATAATSAKWPGESAIATFLHSAVISLNVDLDSGFDVNSSNG